MFQYLIHLFLKNNDKIVKSDVMRITTDNPDKTEVSKVAKDAMNAIYQGTKWETSDDESK